MHLVWAGLIALAVMVTNLLSPVDQLTWLNLAGFSKERASGEFVYLAGGDGLADAGFPNRRIELARALDKVRADGADRLFVDIVFDAPSTPEADAELNRAMAAWGNKLTLVANYRSDLSGESKYARSTPAVARDIPEIRAHRFRNFLGHIWRADYALDEGGKAEPSLPSVLAGVSKDTGSFPIFYGFDISSIPVVNITDVVSGDAPRTNLAASKLRGKTILLGSRDTLAVIPGHIDVPATFVHIYAAETLKSGLTDFYSDVFVSLSAFFLLGLVVLLFPRGARLYACVALVIALPLCALLAMRTGAYFSPSAALALFTAYAALRLRARMKRAATLIDEATKLPTFAALKDDRTVAETMPAIIVARIHRFEEVRKTLPVELHSTYIMRIVDRLRAATPDNTIYAGPGYLIAWTMPEKEPALLQEHLEGLRALFGAPLLVGEHQVDVGITFGVDVTTSPDVGRRLAGAVSAAETTNEIYDPINVSEIASDEDLIWNISLQARIDAALDSGEIYLLYQPKVSVKTGELLGVEALVRWRDPVKGLIPPDHFVRQCENVGRMGHLTRHVLREGCMTGNRFAAIGMPLSVAINVSATMLHETAIVHMVREVLEETGFDARFLTLEVTETYRISNLDKANQVLSQLKQLGPKIAMDDFGVGAASLEALMRLPFDELKVDRLFTSAIAEDRKAAGIVQHVLHLGKTLGITVVAEGVENDRVLDILRRKGCEVAQGFGISRPISFDELVNSHWFAEDKALRNMV